MLLTPYPRKLNGSRDREADAHRKPSTAPRCGSTAANPGQACWHSVVFDDLDAAAHSITRAPARAITLSTACRLGEVPLSRRTAFLLVSTRARGRTNLAKCRCGIRPAPGAGTARCRRDRHCDYDLPFSAWRNCRRRSTPTKGTIAPSEASEALTAKSFCADSPTTRTTSHSLTIAPAAPIRIFLVTEKCPLGLQIDRPSLHAMNPPNTANKRRFMVKFLGSIPVQCAAPTARRLGTGCTVLLLLSVLRRTQASVARRRGLGTSLAAQAARSRMGAEYCAPGDAVSRGIRLSVDRGRMLVSRAFLPDQLRLNERRQTAQRWIRVARGHFGHNRG